MDTPQTPQLAKGVASSARGGAQRYSRKLFVLGGIALSLGILGLLVYSRQGKSGIEPTRYSQVTIGGETWGVMGIAATPATRERGLSFLPELKPKTGLLFVFEAPGQYAFWMKDMQFPIDIIFLSNGTVVRVAEARQPNDLTPILPPSPIDRVLEVNAGEAASIRPGDQALFE